MDIDQILEMIRKEGRITRDDLIDYLGLLMEEETLHPIEVERHMNKHIAFLNTLQPKGEGK